MTDSLINSVVAFANTTGGKILIRVGDNGKIKGVNENSIFKIKDSLTQSIFDSITPKIIPEIYTINIDNKLILVIEFILVT
ncbi:AlbA family DNA-binding domain-containing protein [Campylobacter portucalensis]|uniref:AlbA family DNA-binding domain-containing protein n=1 Tax=Campylobacter portucalensis TaxID=2608384 RepID=UPI002DD9387E|nr:ATP-binding protein [Campylobacter portucalensis]